MLRRTFAVYDQGKTLVHFCLVVVPLGIHYKPRSKEAPLKETCKAQCVYLCSLWKLYVAAEQTGPRFCLSLLMLVLEECIQAEL